VQNLPIVLEIVDAGVEEGMPQYHAARHVVGLAASLANAGVTSTRLPNSVTPDGAVKRALESFRLSPDEALAVAGRRRQGLLEDESTWSKPGDKIVPVASIGDDENGRLQEIESLLSALSG
jgi:hypothetical protein